ncbi:hypothetical protein GOODEAATRI_015599 [Goodea atripinnis]|uniref:Uncharacterized protein n=1 Tax=Goodea atripinnis TaxID=208336 RepID=A0ABV0P587_9TELE
MIVMLATFVFHERKKSDDLLLTEPQIGSVCQCAAPQGGVPGGSPELSDSLYGPGHSNTSCHKTQKKNASCHLELSLMFLLMTSIK